MSTEIPEPDLWAPEAMVIDGTTVPIHDVGLMVGTRWREIINETVFVAWLAPEAVGHARPGPTVTNDKWEIPDRGDRVKCIDPDGREFTGTFDGASMEAGYVEIRIRYVTVDDDE